VETTDGRPTEGLCPAPGRSHGAPPATAQRTAGSRRPVTAAVAALAAFLAVLALLALQLRSNPVAAGLLKPRPRVVIVRRVYETTVHERVIGGSSVSPPIKTSTVTAAAPVATAAAPVTTRVS
jgi:hypothetical protein